MKRILLSIVLLVCVSEIFSQTFRDVPAVKTYINDSIVNNRLLRASSLNKAFNGLQQFLPDIVQDTANVTTAYHGMARFQRKDSTAYVYDTIGYKRWRRFLPGTIGGGVSDHGLLTGLSDDDHSQYHNDTRGDVRYYTKSVADGLLVSKVNKNDSSSNGGYYPYASNPKNFLNQTQTDALYKALGYVPSWSEITGKPSTFSPSSHTHTLSDLLNSGGASGDIIYWNGTAWIRLAKGLNNTVLGVDGSGIFGYKSDVVSGGTYTNGYGIDLSGNIFSLNKTLRDSILSAARTRSTHTGTQAQSTVAGLVDTVSDLRSDINLKADKYTKISINGQVFDLNGDTTFTISDNNNYLTSVTYTAATRIITYARNGLGSLTVEIPKSTPTSDGLESASDKAYQDSVRNGLIADSVYLSISNDSLYMCLKPYGSSTTNCVFQDTFTGGGGGSMVYPGAGIALSTGTGWNTSITNNSVNWNTAYSERNQWDGGSTGLTAATGRTSLGATTVGSNLFTATNPGAVRYIRINADNTVTFLDAIGLTAAINNATTSVAGLYPVADYVNDRTVTTRTNPTGTITHTYGTHGASEYWTFTDPGGRTLSLSGMGEGKIMIVTVSNTSGASIVVTLPSSSYVNGASATTMTIPTGVSRFALSLISGSNNYFLQDGTSGQFFVQGGNSFGATAIIGTSDANALHIYTNGSARQAISSTGLFSFGHTTAGLPFDFRTSNAGNPIMRLRNTSATGYSAIDFDNDANLAQMGIGVSNSSAAANPQIGYINMTNSPFGILYNAVPQLYLNNSKNWGFGDGNTSPTRRFDFLGAVRFRTFTDLGTSTSGYKMVVLDANGNMEVATIPTGGGGSSYYQTFLENGTPETQQGGANFRQVFTLTDGDGRTEIDFDDERKYQPWYTRQSNLTLNSYDGFYGGASGTGSGVAIMTTGNTLPGWLGGVSLATGTTSTGYSYMAAASTATAGSVVISLDSNMRINVGIAIRFEDIFDGTEDWNWHGGLCELVTSTSAITDGVYYRVSRLDSSGQLIACTEAGGVKTEDATGVTLAADTEYKLEITVFEGVAKFYITTGFQGTKTLVSTISTNVPQGSSQNTNMVSLFYKTAGTTSRSAYMRWMAYGTRDY